MSRFKDVGRSVKSKVSDVRQRTTAKVSDMRGRMSGGGAGDKKATRDVKGKTDKSRTAVVERGNRDGSDRVVRGRPVVENVGDSKPTTKETNDRVVRGRVIEVDPQNIQTKAERVGTQESAKKTDGGPGKELVPVEKKAQQSDSPPNGSAQKDTGKTGSDKQTTGDKSGGGEKTDNSQRVSPEALKWVKEFPEDLQRFAATMKPSEMDFMHEALKGQPKANQEFFLNSMKDVRAGKDFPSGEKLTPKQAESMKQTFQDVQGKLHQEYDKYKTGQGDPRFKEMFDSLEAKNAAPKGASGSDKPVLEQPQKPRELTSGSSEKPAEKKSEFDWEKFWKIMEKVWDLASSPAQLLPTDKMAGGS